MLTAMALRALLQASVGALWRSVQTAMLHDRLLTRSLNVLMPSADAKGWQLSV
jgi:hypothetical protein